MVDYAKKTVAELQEILKSRSLSHTGKKAELVARLNEADAAVQENDSVAAPPAEASSAPAAQVPEPAPAPAPPVESTATQAAAPTTTVAEQDPQPSNTETVQAEPVSYALHLPGSNVDSELAKRKARAERFGTGAASADGESGTGTTDVEAAKTLERAKRFGTGQPTVGKLDEALPSDPERGARKRGRPEEASALDDPGLRRGFGGRGRGGRDGKPRGRNERDNSRRRTGEYPAGVVKPATVFSSESDRLAAEARKKRFTSTA